MHVLRLCVLFVLFCLPVYSSYARDQINFVSKPMAAGKALLTENGYVISKTLGVANFSPELRLPIQLIYTSSNRKSGLFGYGWGSPQLEFSYSETRWRAMDNAMGREDSLLC